jgi:hypothetical protein
MIDPQSTVDLAEIVTFGQHPKVIVVVGGVSHNCLTRERVGPRVRQSL